jgi:hypothetical protein
MMVNPTNPRLTPSVTLTPETGWHFTWEARPLYDQAAVDAAVAAERERCAAVAESWATDETVTTCANVAAAIRGPNVGNEGPTR